MDDSQPQRTPEIEVTEADLPLHCPTPAMKLWNLHPRVYLRIETSGAASCPYCGTHYTLKGGPVGAGAH
ncbi:MAG TPA: zinc-finger domain-containing protein [Burkholderiales bacterium]